MAIKTTRTYTASIENQQQVRADLDSLGDSASKIWNVARWTVERIWDETGTIPSESTLKSYMKNQPCWKDLLAQSSQKVVSELSDAFQSWFTKRQKDNRTNPPGYRKDGNTRPKSTVTFKKAGFKLDTKNNRVRLSKGQNMKEHRSDYLLCKYQIRPDIDLSDVESVQNVRVVWKNGTCQLQFVCKVEINTDESPGEKTVGVDLGINNFATLAYESGNAELYPLNCLKEDDYYFSKEISKCDNSNSEQATRLNQKKSDRRTHYLHTLSKHIVQRCVDKNVGTIVVGDIRGIRSDSSNESKNWGKHGNLDLHSWAFDRFTKMLTYKAEMKGITVKMVSERNTSKTCACCGNVDNTNRVERGLYVCDNCEMVANADVNGAENIRQKVTPNLQREDRSTGWMAQPSVFLFDKETGVFAPQKQVTS